MISKLKTIQTTVGKNLTKTVVEDFDKKILRYKQFAHFSQFSKVDRKTTKIPDYVPVVIDGVPKLGTGEILYGIDPESLTLEWLGDIVDSSD